MSHVLSCRVKGTPAVTPSVRPQVPYTPPTSTPSAAAATISVAERAGVQPIAALNPYQKNVSSQAAGAADACTAAAKQLRTVAGAVAVHRPTCSSGCGMWHV